MSDKYETMVEIEEHYRGEWVLVDRPKTDDVGDVLGGHVVWHHRDRDEFDRRLADHSLEDSAIFFAGVLHPDPYEVITVWTDDSIEG